MSSVRVPGSLRRGVGSDQVNVASRKDSRAASLTTAALLTAASPVGIAIAQGTLPSVNVEATQVRKKAKPAPAAKAGRRDARACAQASWLREVMRQLNRHRRVPDAARLRRGRWEVVVAFTLDRTGRIVDAEIALSSGVAALDAEALALIRRVRIPPKLSTRLQWPPSGSCVPVRPGRARAWRDVRSSLTWHRAPFFGSRSERPMLGRPEQAPLVMISVSSHTSLRSEAAAMLRASERRIHLINHHHSGVKHTSSAMGWHHIEWTGHDSSGRINHWQGGDHEKDRISVDRSVCPRRHCDVGRRADKRG